MCLVCKEFVFLQTQFFLISMKVKSILISQPKPEIKNSPYVELIKKFKLKIDFRPFIHIEGKTSREVRQQKIDLSKFSAIILTSRNSVDHFFRIAEEMRYPIPNALNIFVFQRLLHFTYKNMLYTEKEKSTLEEEHLMNLPKSFQSMVKRTIFYRDLMYYRLELKKN